MTTAISPGDVRGLMAADDDAVLVLLEGRAEVIRAADLDDERYRGAVQVISRADLVRQAGHDELSDTELEQQAAALDTAVSRWGG